MLNNFETWINSNKQHLVDNNVFVEYKRNKAYEGPVSATVDVETDSIIGSITVWDIGACDIHLLTKDETAKELLTERYDLEEPKALFSVLEDVFGRIISHSI